jgi:hypothetical protein
MAKEVIVRAGEDPERFATLFDEMPIEILDGDPLYGRFGRRYYPAVFGENVVDRSFAVVAPSGTCVVECDVLDGILGRFGMPLRIVTRTEDRSLRPAIKRAIEELLVIGAETPAERIDVADSMTRDTVSEVGLACLAAGGSLRPALHAVADLSRSDEELRADVRRRYKSHFNWGRRSLGLAYCNRANPDRVLFQSYQDLHEQVARRKTRSQASWDAMYETIAEGGGELTLSTLDGALVGGLLVVDGRVSCYYASAAYVRERFDHPLGHWPMMDAMIRARRRGVRFFDVGEIPMSGDATEKEESIGFFKKGFTARVEIRPIWELTSHGDDPRPT